MQRRPVGRTGVELSVIGFGTCQLRLQPREQALATLVRGFELGVNWVHTSPDYGDAEEIVAQAARVSGATIIPLSDGSGDRAHFEHCFERTLAIHGRTSLPLWGISCIDDQEFVGNDVWGPNGMVAYLAQLKRAGRIQGAYCTTHGPADYVADLITSGVFDAIMLAWNPLGFHVLSSYAAAEGKFYEDLQQTKQRILPLAREHNVAILAMKALAGGLLSRSKAFPPRDVLAAGRDQIAAHEVLRHVLAQEGIVAAVVGTGCVEEAEENALAGHGELALSGERELALQTRITEMRTTLCSRCGACEPTCSRGLPISWLFREAYIWLNPADTFDAVARLHYFHLHEDETLACATCTNRTCLCPQGLDVPIELGRVHARMLELRAQGNLPCTPRELEAAPLGTTLPVRVVHVELPDSASGGTCRFWLENAGDRVWISSAGSTETVELRARSEHSIVRRIALREDVHPGVRSHVAFAVERGAMRAGTVFELARTCEVRGTELAVVGMPFHQSAELLR